MKVHHNHVGTLLQVADGDSDEDEEEGEESSSGGIAANSNADSVAKVSGQVGV